MDADKVLNEFNDYYKILQCGRMASYEELKKSYQRLALTLHPDKINESCEGYETFLILQKAWSILRDPLTRKLYDAELSCQEHSALLLYDTISLSDMQYDLEEKFYSYPCRCGGYYLLENHNLVQHKVIIPCDECSFSVQINLKNDNL